MILKPIYYLRKLDNDKKKYLIITPENKKIKFGDSKYQDFTMHKDPTRKEQYINRHINDNLHTMNSAGFWSMFLLWNQRTIKQSIKDIEKTHKIKIKIIDE
jgi:hypothetical protein